MANLTQTVPFSFDDLFSEARSMFQQAGFDVADGSNTTQLAAIQAYLISSLNTNTALNINETLLPFATKRKNILQDARVLGYEAQHITSFQYKLKIRLSYDLLGYGKIEIPRYSQFTCGSYNYIFFSNDSESSTNGIIINTGRFKIGDEEFNPKDLTFEYADNGYIKMAKTSDGRFIDNLKEIHKLFEKNRDVEIFIKEGELIDSTIDPSSLQITIGSVTVNNETYTRNYIDIPYTDIEDDGINVYVSFYDAFGNYQEKIPYLKTSDYFFEKDPNQTAIKHRFIRLDDIEMGTPRIYFKYAGLGEGVPFGSVVNISILKSSGADGEMLGLNSEKNIFSIPDYTLMYDHEQTEDEKSVELLTELKTEELNVFSGITMPEISSGSGTSPLYVQNIFNDASIIGCDLIVTGKSEETSESIISNAPKVYNSANRLVTNLDFKYACNRSPYVFDSSVWGGEDEFPKCPGHIFFSFVPEKVSERGFEADSNNTEFQRNNSKLVYNYAEGESVYQHQMRQEFYNKNYILNTEIKSYSTVLNENGTVTRKYSGVWGDLLSRFVPSLTFHHRHPIYLNFNYIFNILKYNLKDTTKNTHKILFDALNNCFFGNDSLNLENFDVEYFHSNIVKRIDFLISDLCGFTSELKTQLVLNEKTLCTENWKSEYKDIYIPLAVPFEKYFTDDGYLDTSRLPNIDTENFINFTFDLIRDPLGIYGEDSPVLSEYDGQYISKYSENNLRYSLVKGDLYVDWSKINQNTENNKRLALENSDDVDYSDINKKIFIAPVKIKMKYRYLITQDLINHFSDDVVKIQLGFKVSPENTEDESYNNIQATLYKDNDSGTVVFSKDYLKPFIKYNYENRSVLNLHVYNIDKTKFKAGQVLEIEFERTCGYYYLFNTFKKEILVHLFVNGDYEGFKEASNGLRYNKYYETYLDELSSVWNINENKIYDDTNFADITYSTPKAYLFTSDKKFITADEDASGIEAENVTTDVTSGTIIDNYTPANGKANTRYLTTEGYIIDVLKDTLDMDYYTGEIVRNYSEKMYLYTPLTVDLFRQNVYLNLKYPSLNFKVLRNVVPRLNNVKFKNAIDLY